MEHWEARAWVNVVEEEVGGEDLRDEGRAEVEETLEETVLLERDDVGPVQKGADEGRLDRWNHEEAGVGGEDVRTEDVSEFTEDAHWRSVKADFEFICSDLNLTRREYDFVPRPLCWSSWSWSWSWSWSSNFILLNLTLYLQKRRHNVINNVIAVQI